MQLDPEDVWEKAGSRRRRALADAPPLPYEAPEPRSSQPNKGKPVPKRFTRFLGESLENRKGLIQLYDWWANGLAACMNGEGCARYNLYGLHLQGLKFLRQASARRPPAQEASSSGRNLPPRLQKPPVPLAQPEARAVAPEAVPGGGKGAKGGKGGKW